MNPWYFGASPTIAGYTGKPKGYILNTQYACHLFSNLTQKLMLPISYFFLNFLR